MAVEVGNSLFLNFCLSPTILHILLFSNALGDTTYSQEHMKTMVHAKIWGANKVSYGEFETREQAGSGSFKKVRARVGIKSTLY